MSKNKILKEIKQLIDENVDLKNDLDIMLSEGREFDKAFVKTKYCRFVKCKIIKHELK